MPDAAVPQSVTTTVTGTITIAVTQSQSQSQSQLHLKKRNARHEVELRIHHIQMHANLLCIDLVFFHFQGLNWMKSSTR